MVVGCTWRHGCHAVLVRQRMRACDACGDCIRLRTAVEDSVDVTWSIRKKGAGNASVGDARH
eukprot:945878-Pyramimonas_sp.AAC.1